MDITRINRKEDSDIYWEAVGIVRRDRRVSTSYLQRCLFIGYNRAARLIERMEKDGLIGPADHAGRREIYIGNRGEQA